MAEHLFLTGGTGFIGSRLLRLWLERTEARVTVLLRAREGEVACSAPPRLSHALVNSFFNHAQLVG